MINWNFNNLIVFKNFTFNTYYTTGHYHFARIN